MATILTKLHPFLPAGSTLFFECGKEISIQGHSNRKAGLGADLQKDPPASYKKKCLLIVRRFAGFLTTSNLTNPWDNPSYNNQYFHQPNQLTQKSGILVLNSGNPENKRNWTIQPLPSIHKRRHNKPF